MFSARSAECSKKHVQLVRGKSLGCHWGTRLALTSTFAVIRSASCSEKHLQLVHNCLLHASVVTACSSGSWQSIFCSALIQCMLC